MYYLYQDGFHWFHDGFCLHFEFLRLCSKEWIMDEFILGPWFCSFNYIFSMLWFKDLLQIGFEKNVWYVRKGCFHDFGKRTKFQILRVEHPSSYQASPVSIGCSYVIKSWSWCLWPLSIFIRLKVSSFSYSFHEVWSCESFFFVLVVFYDKGIMLPAPPAPYVYIYIYSRSMDIIYLFLLLYNFQEWPFTRLHFWSSCTVGFFVVAVSLNSHLFIMTTFISGAPLHSTWSLKSRLCTAQPFGYTEKYTKMII